jgi:hypothetical protein
LVNQISETYYHSTRERYRGKLELKKPAPLPQPPRDEVEQTGEQKKHSDYNGQGKKRTSGLKALLHIRLCSGSFKEKTRDRKN